MSVRLENRYIIGTLFYSKPRTYLDLLRFGPDVFTFWLGVGSHIELLVEANEEGWAHYRDRLRELDTQSRLYDFRSVCRQIEKVFVQIGQTGKPASSSIVLIHIFIELKQRIREELNEQLLFVIPYSMRSAYVDPLRGWEQVVERYDSPVLTSDISEASRCLTTDRYTACVFHLMRVVEFAVLQLEWVLEKHDVKAHFGSVVDKLEKLAQKTDYEKLPEIARPHINFLKGILPQLHAVKNSWRNKVSHVDIRILPLDGYTEEIARDIYSATRGLMRKMAAEAPHKNMA
jgi:hypothetical protein